MPPAAARNHTTTTNSPSQESNTINTMADLSFISHDFVDNDEDDSMEAFEVDFGMTSLNSLHRSSSEQANNRSAAAAAAAFNKQSSSGVTDSFLPLNTSSDHGPVDLDELLEQMKQAKNDDDDANSFFLDGNNDGGDHQFNDEHAALLEEWDDDVESATEPKFFNNPNKRLLDNDASLIPGSPFSKPANKPSNRPSEPLAIAKYASVVGFAVTIGWVAYLIFSAIWNYSAIGRIILEIILALLSFCGLFWNSYYIVSSIFKCFIPTKAFKTNTKYCSIIPETKDPTANWLEVTIQIPVYKESLKEVMMPTLKSCMASRDYYLRHTNKTRCNIVVCDDGIMAFLRDNFPAAEMLWDGIVKSKGRVMKLSQLLKHVPRASRRHVKGLRSRNVYQVFHRMLFYYHGKIGFVARSTVDRRGKFKKASNLNSHLRLALGAAQMVTNAMVNKIEPGPTFLQALMEESHNEDGSRYIMFGNDIAIGELIVVNDADARMAESVILKTVPEFLNDKTLGFTQHATKTMDDQRGESYFTNMLAVYTDALYQGHFLLSSILGCHPPLVGHSIFLRTEAVKQCGRMRTLRKAQRWLKNIGLQFLPVDQVGFSNLQAENRIEYWSENHVSEDFELMIHLYNLGFNGRYCAYPDCEFQEGITRNFDEEAGRHRKFSLGAHELVFNPFQDMLGHGIFTPLFWNFLTCDIPSYYKVFLAAYLCSYTSGGIYLIVFTAAAIMRILDNEDIKSLWAFSPAGVIILNFVIYYILGYITFLISILRMYYANNKLLFAQYRKKYCGACYIIFVKLRYCLLFQFLFYSVVAFTFYFLGSMDHLLSRPGVVSATNKDSIDISRCVAFWDTAKFNSGSWLIAILVAGLAYTTVLQDNNWNPAVMPDNIVEHALFAGPPLLLALMALVVPIILNPYILGWPFLRQQKPKKKQKKKKKVKKDPLGRPVVDINTFMNNADQLQDEIERVEGKPDIELGSLETRDLRSGGGVSPMMNNSRKTVDNWKAMGKQPTKKPPPQSKSGKGGMYSIPEFVTSDRPGASRKKPSSSSQHRPSSKSRHSSQRRPSFGAEV